MRQARKIRKRHERGYALLMVFLLAATIAIGLYTVAPRVAFESQRDKEQLLVDRGEQYKRAIQLYYRKFRKYPVKMEDLENTSNIRFLRQRYVDPMTGKNEWRLIHVGPGGQFTDSLTQKNTKKTDPAASANTFIAEFKSVADPSDAADQLSPALRRRPSDQGAVNGGTLGGDGNAMAVAPDPNNPNPAFNSDPNQNGGAFPTNGSFAGVSGLPSTGGDGSGATPTPTSTGYVPGGEMPLAMQQQLQQQMQQNGGAPQTTIIGPNGTFSSPASGPAAIQQLLTSPRPGGPPPGIFNPGGRPMNDYGFTDPNGNNLPSPLNPQSVGNTSAFGTQTGSTGSAGSGLGSTLGSPLASATQSGGGNFATGSFAGVASTLERHGIKKYADHNKYNEWEFIYDYAKDVAKASGLAVNSAGANTNSPNQNGLNNSLGNTLGNSSGNSSGTTTGSGTAVASGTIGATSPTPTSN